MPTAFEVTADGKKLLVAQQEEVRASSRSRQTQKFEKPMRTADIEVPVDPRAEWRQMFADAFRFERDFFYDPSMHGVDWTALRERYGKLLDDAVTRWDVNFVLGEFIGELNASHTYRGGGDEEQAPQRVGRHARRRLGARERRLPHQAHRRAADRGTPTCARRSTSPASTSRRATTSSRSTACRSTPTTDPWARFQGLGDKTVVLTVNDTPSTAGARQVVVKCLDDEIELRFRAWIEERRADRRQGDRAARSATSTCRAPASTRRTSWCGSSWRSGRRTA